jgi:hypothetical protein
MKGEGLSDQLAAILALVESSLLSKREAIFPHSLSTVQVVVRLSHARGTYSTHINSSLYSYSMCHSKSGVSFARRHCR